MNLSPFKILNYNKFIEAQRIARKQGKSTDLLVDPEIIKKLKREHFPEWTITTCIYGDKKIVTAVMKVIKQKMKNHASDIYFFTQTSLKKLNLLKKFFPFHPKLKFIDQLNNFFDLSLGHPDETALIIPYLKSGIKPSDKALNPDQDGCGLIWFAPLVPIKAHDVEIYLTTVKKILIEHHMEPVMTLTPVSNYCFDSAVPILFNKNDKHEIENAHACYQRLFSECKAKGFLPYRIPIDFMDMVVDERNTYWQLVQSIKNAIDPHRIISPGRYA